MTSSLPVAGARILAPPEPFAGPFGVSVSDHWIVVTDDLAHRISLFRLDGSLAGAFGQQGSEAGEFAWPDAAVVDRASGRLFVADTGNHRIQALDVSDPSSPSFVSSFGRAWFRGLRNPRDVVIGPGGAVPVADFGRGRVRVFDREGRHLRDIGDAGPAEARLAAPIQLAVQPGTDHLFVSDTQRHAVVVFDSQGRFVRAIGAFDPAPSGSGAPPSGGPSGLLQSPHGLDFGPDGDLYVANHGRDRVEVFSVDGRWLRAIGRSGTSAGELRTPTDLAFLPDGTLVVVDAGNHRVQLWPPSPTPNR